MNVYELGHYYQDDNGYDIITNIGVFSTKKKAVEVMERLKKHNYFKNHKNDFYIDVYRLNENCWNDGFIGV